MLTLMRKDFRLLRPVGWTYAALASMFWVVLPTFTGWQRWSNGVEEARRGGRPVVVDWAGIAANAILDWAIVLWLPLLILVLVIGALAFASERRERWADFTAMLPVSRRRIVLNKLAASFAACVVLAVTNAVVSLAVFGLVRGRLWLATTYSQVSEGRHYFYFSVAAALVGIGFGVGWLARRSHARFWSATAAVALTVISISAANAVNVEIVHTYSGQPPIWTDPAVKIWMTVAMALFGTGWLLSCLLTSPVIAAGVSGGTVGVILVSAATLGAQRIMTERAWAVLFFGFASWGVLATVAGCVIQTVRRSP